MVRTPTHSLPPGRHKPFAAAGCCTGAWSGWGALSKRWQRALNRALPC